MSTPPTCTSSKSVYVALGAVGAITVAALFTHTPLDQISTIIEALLGFAGIRQAVKLVANK